ncbi:DUF5675 family protein [Desulfocurvus sp. DL9XJH121]
MRFDPVVEIIRLEESAQGTLGALRLNKELVCATLEPPDRENAAGVSSIPAQQYRCARHASAKFGETFEVLDVPGRTHVLFHAGNTAAQTRGCILLGGAWGRVGGGRAVLDSREAFTRFMDRLSGADSFHLTIYEQY